MSFNIIFKRMELFKLNQNKKKQVTFMSNNNYRSLNKNEDSHKKIPNENCSYQLIVNDELY